MGNKMINIMDIRTSGKYPAYTPDFRPLYYITQYGYTICAYCAEQNNKECKIPYSDLFVEKAMVNYGDPGIYCSICNQKIEMNIELKEARQISELLSVEGKML